MKTIIISGGTSGIGLELVKYFAENQYKVIFTGRNKILANTIIQQLTNKEVHFVKTDFASFDSILSSVEYIEKEFKSVDILINNAGVWEMECKESEDNIERNFAVNHLAPMLFTLKLLPIINKENGRIINTSSGAHRRNILDLDDIEWRHKNYDGVATYSQSKLCNIYFTKQLSKELKNTNILVNTVHPGYVKTQLFNKMGNRSFEGVPNAFEGARSAIFAVTNSKIVNQSNLYIFQEKLDSNITEMAKDDVLAEKIWNLSMKYLHHKL